MKFYITREQSNIWQYSHNGQPRLDERASQMAGHGALARCLQPPSICLSFCRQARVPITPQCCSKLPSSHTQLFARPGLDS